jgi:uncharacterized membrane protein YbaN (DUF454 family)
MIIGIIGIFVPLLPTTPFLLLAAACYARSSRRLYRWLISNKWIGKYVSSYREGEGIPVRVKALTIAVLWLTIGFSIFCIISSIVVKLILMLIAIGVTVHVLWLPTFKGRSNKTDRVISSYKDCSVEE